MLRASLFVGLAFSCSFLARLAVEPVLERGERLGSALGQLSQSREPAPRELAPPSSEEEAVPLEQHELEAASEAPPPTPRAGKKAKRATSAPLAAPKHGIRVRKASVLRLARARAIPTSAFTPKTPQRPAGLVLSGVGGLGIGMQDGDVLTHVGGVPVSARGQVVNLVLQARARRATELTARFYRGSEPWMLVVEIPYLEAKPASSNEP